MCIVIVSPWPLVIRMVTNPYVIPGEQGGFDMRYNTNTPISGSLIVLYLVVGTVAATLVLFMYVLHFLAWAVQNIIPIS